MCEMTQEEENALSLTPADRIEQLKELLAATDYKTLKYVEGRLGEEEFAAACAEREAWRSEINLLEEQD